MANPAIAATLRAAGEAARQAVIKPGCCMEGTGCELPPCHCSQVAAAAAIEAFHLHMAAHWHGFAPAWQAQHTEIAAAVARAAKESGHG